MTLWPRSGQTVEGGVQAEIGQGSATTEEETWGHASQLTSPRNWRPSVVAVTDTETHIKYSEEDSRNFFLIKTVTLFKTRISEN